MKRLEVTVHDGSLAGVGFQKEDAWGRAASANQGCCMRSPYLGGDAHGSGTDCG
jgi:hypothetical protein